MKKKGTTFIEIVVAITIFLIAILPVTYLTLNSLRALKRASEIEEGARVATTVINYIKSRGYYVILEGETKSLKTSNIKWVDDDGDEVFSASYTLTSSDGAYISTDFEEDFYGDLDLGDGIFFIESLGINLEGTVIDVFMEKASLNLAQEKISSDGVTIYYDILEYTNPISASPSNVIFGSNGIVTDEIIYGLVRVNYTSKSTTDSAKAEKQYEQPFVVTPLENF